MVKFLFTLPQLKNPGGELTTMDNRITLMRGVAGKLFAAEGTIDGAITDTAALLAEMIEARKAAKVSTVVDAKANAKVIEAMAALSAARTAMAEAHTEMNEVKLRLGVRTRMDLIDVRKQGSDFDEPAEARLRVVNEG
jgi:hypothetical protein